MVIVQYKIPGKVYIIFEAGFVGTDTLHTVNQSTTVPWELIDVQYVKCWDSEKYNIYFFWHFTLNCNKKNNRSIWYLDDYFFNFISLRILYSVSLLIKILVVEQFLEQHLQQLGLMYLQMQYLGL